MKRYKVVIAALACFLLMALAFIVFIFWPTADALPDDVRSDIIFSPFVVSEDSTVFGAQEYRLSKAEDGTQLSNFAIRYEGMSIETTQYTQPQQFEEIPEFKDRFLSGVAKQYATVQTSNGTIYLGRLEKQDNKQLAVMLERGLIVFMSPEKDLSEATWRSVGDSLEIQRILN